MDSDFNIHNMITFQVNGKATKVKSSWDDVTYGEYLAILDAGGDTSKILSILTGINSETLRKSKIKGADQLLIAIGFANKPVEIMPKISQVGPYKLPMKGGKFDIQFESLGQFEDLRAVLTSGIKDSTEVLKSYPKAVAIYLQKIRDGEYDGMKAQDMETEVLAMPCREVLTAGSFFLLKLLTLYAGTKDSSPKAASPTRRTGKSSTKRSGRTARSTKRRAR